MPWPSIQRPDLADLLRVVHINRAFMQRPEVSRPTPSSVSLIPSHGSALSGGFNAMSFPRLQSLFNVQDISEVHTVRKEIINLLSPSEGTVPFMLLPLRLPFAFA